VITGFGTALPPAVAQEELWEGFFAEHFSHRRAARLSFRASGVSTRHAAVNPLAEDISAWSTGARMERYVTEAIPLGKEAVSAALERSGVSPTDLGLFTVVSCTGYATPGIDVRLARDLAMSPTLHRLGIGHMGCHAGLPALGTVRDFVAVHQQPAALLCLELSSLHVQPPTDDPGQAVVHSLFADAAAAIVVEPATGGGSGLEVVDLVTRSDLTSAEYMGWDVTDLGFRMTLSRHVVDVVAREIGPLVDGLLARNGLTKAMVAGWAVHPGGPRILDVVGERLGLADDDLDASRSTLAAFGNCSSATILLVLEEVSRRIPARTPMPIVALAFGPGLTLCAALLRSR
jgi:predicted naringenin-chalcone synthase